MSPRTELSEYLKFFPTGVVFSQEAKGRYCDWLSPCKRKVVPPGTPPLLPGSNMAGHPEPFQNTPRTFRGPFPSHLPSASLHRGHYPGAPGSGLAGPAPSARATPTGPLQPIGGRAAPIGSARLPRPQPRCGPRLPGRPVAPLSVARARGGRSPRRHPSGLGRWPRAAQLSADTISQPRGVQHGLRGR